MPRGWMDEQRDALPLALCSRLREATQTSAREDTLEVQERRRANVFWLVGEARGAKSQFARHVSWHVGELQQIKARPFGHKRAETLEQRLGLPPGWLDVEHSELGLPEEFEDRLAALQQLSPPAADDPDTVLALPDPPARPADISLEGITSPVSRALVEKLIGLARRNLLPDLTAVQMLSALVQLEAGLPAAITSRSGL